MDNQQGLPYSTGNSAQCYVAGCMGGEFEEECLCMAEPLCGPPETIMILLISYSPIQNKKFLTTVAFKLPCLLNENQRTIPFSL